MCMTMIWRNMILGIVNGVETIIAVCALGVGIVVAIVAKKTHTNEYGY